MSISAISEELEPETPSGSDPPSNPAPIRTVDCEFQIDLQTRLKELACYDSSRIRIRIRLHSEHGAHYGNQAVDTTCGSEATRNRSVAHASRRHRCLIQPTTVRLPSIRTDTRAGTARDNARFRRAPVQPRMRSIAVIVPLEIEELHLQIRGRRVRKLGRWVRRPRGNRT